MAGMQYRLVIKDNESGEIEYDNWFNSEAERRNYFERIPKSEGKSYLIQEEEVPSYDPNEPPSGEWRSLSPPR